jgi:PilZ domain
MIQHIERIDLKGSVIVHVGPHAQRERLINLSHSGLLATATAEAASYEPGSAVEIELRLDGQHAEWLHVSGRIVRVGPEGIAIAFDAPLPELARMIDEMSTASHARLRVMSVILVDADPARRPLLASAFRTVGCLVVETSTPLEAIVRLGESSFEFNVIAIADSTPGAIADELRNFVERNHPYVKLITIGNDLVEPSGTGHWLSSADPASDLAARVREILGRHRPPTRP